MRRSWSGRELIWLLACGVGVPNLSGCGGQEFSSGQGSGASSNGGDGGTGGKASGGGGSGSNGGDQNMGGSSEPGGSSGSGGSGGTVISGCDCGPGQYCRDSTNDCFDCAELSRLRFRTPERLDTLSSNNQASHFPRIGETSTDLLYSVTGAGMRYTTDFSTSAGSTVGQSMAQDSGPLLLPESVMLMGGDFNFAFDRVTEMGRRQLFFAQWQGGLGMFGPAPAPFNGGASDYSVAIATSPTDGIARAYWMTDRDQNLGVVLVTALLTENAAGDPVELSVGSNRCEPEKADLSPWVSADGQTLLFSQARVETSCTTDDPDEPDEPKDIYTVLLQPSTGQPTGGIESPAVPLADVNGPTNDVDPSFSADFCDLYFASDRDGSYALYRAHRR